jgi:hypothetical protein
MPHMLGSAARVVGAATRLGSPLAGAEKESEAWTAASMPDLSSSLAGFEGLYKKRASCTRGDHD